MDICTEWRVGKGDAREGERDEVGQRKKGEGGSERKEIKEEREKDKQTDREYINLHIDKPTFKQTHK